MDIQIALTTRYLFRSFLLSTISLYAYAEERSKTDCLETRKIEEKDQGEDKKNDSDAKDEVKDKKEDEDKNGDADKKDDDRKDDKIDENDPKNWPLKKGNLSLPVSQQPGPLVGFGQHIVEEDQLQFYLMGTDFRVADGYVTLLTPGVVYGIRDDLSIFINIPESPGNRIGVDRSSGIEDAFATLEYIFLDKSEKYTSDQATLVGTITVPTGSTRKNPPTGFGSPTFFLGGTFNHTTPDWFYFVQPGVLFTTSYHGTQYGYQALYQFGYGRCIATPKGWIIAWMIEGDGVFSCRNRINGQIDPNSGGNVFYLTPSIWISSDNLIIQFGVGYPVAQELFGKQPKLYTAYTFTLGFTF